MKVLRQLLTRQYFLFLLAGGGSVLVNVLVRWILSHSLNFPTAVALAHLVSTVTAFTLNALITFNTQDKIFSRLQKYIFVNIFGLAQVLFVSLSLMQAAEYLLQLPKEMIEAGSHVIALATLSVTSFLLHKKFTFN